VKKTILILILVLPVVVVSLVYMIAGFVVRQAAVMPIDGVRIVEYRMHLNGVYHLPGTDEDGNFNRAMAENWRVGQAIDLGTFIIPLPAPRARFSALDITIEFSTEADMAVAQEREAAIVISESGIVTVNRVTAGLAIIRIDEFFSIEIWYISAT